MPKKIKEPPLHLDELIELLQMVRSDFGNLEVCGMDVEYETVIYRKLNIYLRNDKVVFH